MPACARCSGTLPADIKVFRQTLCPHCSAYLHACIQCRFHDPAAHNQCREPQAEFVSNREQANFCEFFRLGAEGVGGGRAGDDARARDARAKLESLFRKPGETERGRD